MGTGRFEVGRCPTPRASRRAFHPCGELVCAPQKWTANFATPKRKQEHGEEASQSRQTTAATEEDAKNDDGGDGGGGGGGEKQRKGPEEERPE